MIDVGRQISLYFLTHFRKCTVLQTLYANGQNRTFKIFYKSINLFLDQYPSFFVWFLLSFKLWSPLKYIVHSTPRRISLLMCFIKWLKLHYNRKGWFLNRNDRKDQHMKSISLIWQSSQIIKDDICLDTFFFVIYFTTITSTHTLLQYLFNVHVTNCWCCCLLSFE
jgi:hypothetical protein